MEPLSSEHAHTMDPCGHRFHSSCIIGWMQRGHLSCPTCRTDLHQHHESVPAMALLERAKYIRRTLGRRANVPPDLKRLLEKVRKAENAEREHQRLCRQFRDDNRQLLKESNQLRRKRYALSRTTWRMRRLLGLYQAPGLILPALVVYA